jgi:hypothetical protein
MHIICAGRFKTWLSWYPNADGALVWVAMGTNQMVEKGLISDNLAKALIEEYKRRRDSEALYAHQPFGTLVASRPL